MVSTLGGGGLRWRWSWCECIDAPLHHRSIQAFVIVTLTYEMCLCVNRQLKHRLMIFGGGNSTRLKRSTWQTTWLLAIISTMWL